MFVQCGAVGLTSLVADNLALIQSPSQRSFGIGIPRRRVGRHGAQRIQSRHNAGQIAIGNRAARNV